MDEDEQQIILNDSDIAATELPKILMKATNNFKTSISKLSKDEYGDLIINAKDGNDKNSYDVLK
jgi:hypothetical protein